MPLEVHHHYNAVGNYTGATVIDRESVWDDASRASATAFVEFEQSLDHTGIPREDAFRKQRFVVTDVTNYAAMAIEQQKQADERDAKDHPNAKNEDGSAKYPEGWQAARRYNVRPATAEELEEAQLVEEVLHGD